MDKDEDKYFKAGRVIYLPEKETRTITVNLIQLMDRKKKEALTKELESIKIREAEIIKLLNEPDHKPERWRAEKGEEYWYIDDFGCCTTAIEDNHYADEYRHRIGNYFKTKEEAEKWKLYHDTICEMNTWHDERGRWFVYWCSVGQEYLCELGLNKKSFHIRFSTKEKGEAFIEHFKDRLDIVYR